MPLHIDVDELMTCTYLDCIRAWHAVLAHKTGVHMQDQGSCPEAGPVAQ